MARGRKKVIDYDAEIKNLEAEITKLSDIVKKKRTELKALKAKKQEADNVDIIKAIESSGKTKEEIIKLLKK